MADKSFPTSKTQKMVADALGIKVSDYTDADRKFAEIGIVVSSKREGRNSVPVVRLTGRGGGFNAWGEGESEYTTSTNLSAIKQWME